VIQDEVIDGYLDNLFGSSEPGQTMHHMLFATAGAADRTALGLPTPDGLKVTYYAIAPTEEVDADQFVAQTIVAAIAEARQKDAVVYFAGLAVEGYAVIDDGTELTENLARRLQADRKLEEHPGAVEVTRLYAACRDGRRWVGEHHLTGPKAGTVSGPQVRVGALARQEGGLHQRLVRAAVGLGLT
jgi:hypothetical protein